ncbi:type II secretion system F family protein [Streptomyces sp. NPDC059698]|uniref:type II secretion system F family protein n=1 Tax=unclassified Streptomyces TaxID=2593676 RepID=UPI00093FCA82|nr:type II secretion system F family protein [Streptomyces sp. CB02366]OKJ41305.1 type II secretion protein F [Streptomyces sp. CB02366]
MSASGGGVLHSLGTAAALLGLAGQLAAMTAARYRRRAVRGRGALLVGAAVVAHPGRRGAARMAARLRPTGGPGASGPARRWAVPAGAWLTGWILVGGVLGCVAGSVAAYGAWRWQRTRLGRGAEGTGPDRAVIAGQLPLAADLLAACIAVGAGPGEAAEEVGASIGGPVGDGLARTAAEIRLGGEPAEAWGRFAEIPGAGPLARCLYRAGSTGAPAAEPVARLAESMRAERSAAAVARAQRAGVLITAPVGLCFLPAFLTVGVAPVIIGLAGGLLSGDGPGR